MKRFQKIRVMAVVLAAGWGIPLSVEAASPAKPDVLFIAVDDMNDWISLLDPASPIKTPNLERLANRGMLFTRAYCISPACNPSRAATLTGLRPSTTGVYGNKTDWRRATPSRKTIMQRFQDGGYAVRGAGKIFHHHLGGAYHDDASFEDFQPMAPQNMPPKKLNQAAGYGSRNTDWGAWPANERDTIDFKTADYCIEALSKPPSGAPLFLACGIFKPHSPFFAPASYHEGLDGMALPERREDDWADLPEGARKLLHDKKWFWTGMEKLEERLPGSYPDFIQAYAACCRFVDAQIGRVLDALDGGPCCDNTIVVLWSDHGFHLGEKNHIEKFALWEKSNHIPFIVVAPGVTQAGRRCDTPVDLSVLYPTLLELGGLPADVECDGVSIVPLLKDPDADWQRPALMSYGQGNHAVRSERWRYIRYHDGSEELYDHQNDANEWTNLAAKSEHAEVIQSHRAWIPKAEADPVPALKKGRRTHYVNAPFAPKKRPNILFIVSEDNGPELSCYGEPFVKTPVLDRLAEEGVRFEHAYVPQAGCSQSRAAFLTGLYPHQNGQIGLATWKYAMYHEDTPNVVTTLKKAGYRTGNIGKLHVNPESAFPFDFNAIPSANFGRKKMAAYREQAAAFIEQDDQPFYLQVNYPDAHRPFIQSVGGLPAQPLTAGDVDALAFMGINHPELKQQTADYYNCMMRLDAYVGDLLKTLETSGKADNTVVVYIGDHGADVLRGKRTSYEGGVRIPMIVRWPGAKAGQVRSELVSTLDLFPTFCEIAGVPVLESLPGHSLKALVHGAQPIWRRYLFTEFHVHSNHNPWPQRTVRDARYKLIYNPLAGEVNPGYAFTFSKKFFKASEAELLAAASPQVRAAYALTRKPPRFELYDLQEDPYELKNLAEDPDFAVHRGRLISELMHWQKETGDALKFPEIAERLFSMIRDAGTEKRKTLNYKSFMEVR